MTFETEILTETPLITEAHPYISNYNNNIEQYVITSVYMAWQSFDVSVSYTTCTYKGVYVSMIIY